MMTREQLTLMGQRTGSEVRRPSWRYNRHLSFYLLLWKHILFSRNTYECTWSKGKDSAIPAQALRAARVWRSQDFWTFHKWRWQGCQPYALAALNIHFSYRLSRLQGPTVTWRLMSIKNVHDHTGNRTRDLPTYKAVPQSTAPLSARNCYKWVFFFFHSSSCCLTHKSPLADLVNGSRV